MYTAWSEPTCLIGSTIAQHCIHQLRSSYQAASDNDDFHGALKVQMLRARAVLALGAVNSSFNLY
jgi:hypothetical protein